MGRVAALTSIGVLAVAGAAVAWSASRGPQEQPQAVTAAPRMLSARERRPAPTVARAEPTAEERRLAVRRRLEAGIRWRRSRAFGLPWRGRLVAGVRLPAEGVHFFTWNPARWASPSPAWRRNGTDRLVRTILAVAAEFAAANPDAPRIAVGDLSRSGGGDFGARFGFRGEFGRGGSRGGHVSHQNGLDVDIYYPRLDRKERAPDALADVDLALAQHLVDRFVAAGAQFVFVGPRTGLTGPPQVVQPLRRHDDHLHVRLPPD